MKLKFKKLCSSATIPSYAHEGDSGMDISSSHSFTLPAKRSVKVMTGLAVDIPEGFELQVRPRSGLAARYGIFTVFGTIDAGYKGEIGITLVSMSDGDYSFDAGDRIAQLVLAPVVRADIRETDDVGTSDRGSNGFGSTGV